MEPGIKEFFKRLTLSIGLCIVWMTINLIIGVKLGYFFFEDKIRFSNVAFYIWLVVSFTGVIFLYIKIWKKPIENLND